MKPEDINKAIDEMSDTPRAEAAKVEIVHDDCKFWMVGLEPFKELERELNKAKAEQYALAANFIDIKARLAAVTNQRDEARECLLEAINQYLPDAEPLALTSTMKRWRTAALEGAP